MSDKTSAADWLGDWQALQQRYWTSMGELARKVGDQAAQAQPPAMPKWHEGLEIWARAFQGGQNGSSEVMERALQHGKVYLDMLQRMGGLAARPAGEAGAQDWSSAFSEMMKGLGSGIGGIAIESLRDVSAHGARGIEHMMADLQPMLSMFLGEARSILGVQPFGMGREHQARQQALAAAVVEYQQVSVRYQGLLARSLERGLEMFEGKLAERSEPGRQIDSPKALFDLWVDAAEEGYAEVAMSQDFQDVYGELVNAQMRVRQLLQDQVERMCTSLGMPTRSEVNSVHRKLAALKRSAADGPDWRALAEEVAALKARLDGGEESGPAKPRRTSKKGASATARKTGPRKPAAERAAKPAAARSETRSAAGRAAGKAASSSSVDRRAAPAGKRKKAR